MSAAAVAEPLTELRCKGKGPFKGKPCDAMLGKARGTKYRLEIICKKCKALNVFEVPHPLSSPMRS